MKAIKSFILMAVACFFITNTTEAAVILERDVPEIDFNKMYSITNGEAEMVQASSEMAVFSTNNYTSGLFDLYGNDVVQSHNLPGYLIDNNVSTGQTSTSSNQYTINFNQPLDITGFYAANLLNNYSVGTYQIIRFIKSDGTSQNTGVANNKNTVQETYRALDIKDVVSVVISFVNVDSNIYTREFELFIDPSKLYQSVSDLKITNIDLTSIEVNWSNPTTTLFRGNKIYLNDVLVSSDTLNSFKFDSLESNTEYKITIAAVYNDFEIKNDLNLRTLRDTTPPGEITNFIVMQKGETVILEWTNPNDLDFQNVNIYKNDVLLKENVKDTSIIDTQVVVDRIYNYKIITVDKDGNESNGTIKTIKVNRITAEVRDLKASAKDFSEVELTWKNPNAEDFETVTIYRKNQESGILARVMRLLSTDEYTPIFQTNGTLFKDLTVTPETSYEYKVTSLVAGVESEGVTTQVTTPQIAVINPEIIKEDPSDPTNQNFLFRWEKPTQGSIKILIDGKEFATVNAAAKQQLIPADKMVYDVLGNARIDLIQIIAIDEDGNEGAIVKPKVPPGGGGVGLVDISSVGLGGKELLQSGISLFSVIAIFVLLGLSFPMARKLILTIRKAILKKSIIKGG